MTLETPPLSPLEDGEGQFLDEDDQMVKVLRQWDWLMEKMERL